MSHINDTFRCHIALLFPGVKRWLQGTKPRHVSPHKDSLTPYSFLHKTTAAFVTAKYDATNWRSTIAGCPQLSSISHCKTRLYLCVSKTVRLSRLLSCPDSLSTSTENRFSVVYMCMHFLVELSEERTRFSQFGSDVMTYWVACAYVG